MIFNGELTYRITIDNIKMSFKGIIEFVVNLQSYYIIEYPQQGLFSFHFRIYQALQQRKVTPTFM